jgi:hypothetical protein
MRRGKIPGAEFEFDKPLDALERSAEKAEESTSPSPVVYEKTGGISAGTHVGSADAGRGEEHATVEVVRPSEKDIEDEIGAILASGSPKGALVILAAEIERAARHVLASSQDPANWEHQPFWQTLNRLDLSPPVRDAVGEFREVRNRIVHGRGATDDEVIRAIDSGLRILRAVEAIPYELHLVFEPRVAIFADAQGEVERSVHGVMLESRTPGRENTYRVYPTAKTDFEKGKAVTWEWTFERTWPESWYCDPRTDTIEYAWTSSAEFAGRHMEDV